MHSLTRHGGGIFSAICMLLVTARTASAGPMPPCIEATLSANGRVLVTNQLTYDSPDENHDRHVIRSAFRVLRRYVDLNEHLRLNGPDTYGQARYGASSSITATIRSLVHVLTPW